MALPRKLAVVAEEAASGTDIVPVNGFHLEPRCHVCRKDRLRGKVNNLLAQGASYAYIVRALEGDNAQLDQRDRVTIDSVRNHSSRHFAVQNVAQAAYRDILERRARENGVDFVNGVVTALTPMALYETVMVKGYQSLVDADTEVDVNTAMIAAGRLQSLIDSRSDRPDIAEMMVQVHRLVGVVHSMVPQSQWPELERKLGDIEPSDNAAEGFEDTDCAEDDESDEIDIDDFEDDDDL
ncbi:MAG: hypothetical protein K2X52_15955 [Mycobacteriaceae bacterium]|nr:hypothetical protein [Mycobacteriaceae bacterium]